MVDSGAGVVLFLIYSDEDRSMPSNNPGCFMSWQVEFSGAGCMGLG